MRAAALILISLTGCMLGERDIEVDDSIYKIHDQDKVMLYAHARVEIELGRDIPYPDHTDVLWTSTVCPYRMDQYAVVYEDRCYYGIMWSCGEMYVALSNKDPRRTCGSALVHEFGHCLRMQMNEYPDHSHSDYAFWDLMGEIHDQTCDSGW